MHVLVRWRLLVQLLLLLLLLLQSEKIRRNVWLRRRHFHGLEVVERMSHRGGCRREAATGDGGQRRRVQRRRQLRRRQMRRRLRHRLSLFAHNDLLLDRRQTIRQQL